jgi:hypothetical protein
VRAPSDPRDWGDTLADAGLTILYLWTDLTKAVQRRRQKAVACLAGLLLLLLVAMAVWRGVHAPSGQATMEDADNGGRGGCAGVSVPHGCELLGSTWCLSTDASGATRARVYALRAGNLVLEQAPGARDVTIHTVSGGALKKVSTAYLVYQDVPDAPPVYVSGAAALCLAARVL